MGTKTTDVKKNPEEGLTKKELLDKFQNDPLSCRFFKTAKKNFKQRIRARKNQHEKSIEAFIKEKEAEITKAQETLDRETANYNALCEKYKTGVSRTSMEEAAGEYVALKNGLESKIAKFKANAEEELAKDLKLMKERSKEARAFYIKACSWEYDGEKLTFYQSELKDPELSEQELKEKYGDFDTFDQTLHTAFGPATETHIMFKTTVKVRKLRVGETIEDFILNKIRRCEPAASVIAAEWQKGRPKNSCFLQEFFS